MYARERGKEKILDGWGFGGGKCLAACGPLQRVLRGCLGGCFKGALGRMLRRG